jgi:ribonuclease E
MADWKQITARIRRARTGKDPAGQLTALFLKTRDAMVAFELARFFESNGKTEDAGKWYMTAAERFRRADWKTKAQESATRLGATVAAEIPAPAAPADLPEVAASDAAVSSLSPEPVAQETPAPAAEVTQGEEHQGEAPQEASVTERAPAKRQRRGRRGGRDHRRSSKRPEPTVSAPKEARPAPPPPRALDVSEERPARPMEPLELSAESPVAPSLRGRSGDPGLASRLTQLEMNFRRLLACPPTKLEAADKAPAGPGVWVLTDSDLTTYYYVEACQTLRVAIPNLMRSSAARRGESIRPQLADHLGIPESRVAKYLSDHCVVRWLQMDDDAAHFAHFLVAVLHPTLNE